MLVQSNLQNPVAQNHPPTPMNNQMPTPPSQNMQMHQQQLSQTALAQLQAQQQAMQNGFQPNNAGPTQGQSPALTPQQIAAIQMRTLQAQAAAQANLAAIRPVQPVQGGVNHALHPGHMGQQGNGNVNPNMGVRVPAEKVATLKAQLAQVLKMPDQQREAYFQAVSPVNGTGLTCVATYNAKLLPCTSADARTDTAERHGVARGKYTSTAGASVHDEHRFE